MKRMLVLAVIVGLALAGCSGATEPTPTPGPRVAEIVVTGAGVSYRDAFGGVLGSVPFTAPPTAFHRLLVKALGPSTDSTTDSSDGWQWGSTVFVGRGYGADSFARITVLAKSYRGVLITADGRAVGDRFPALYSEPSCALGDHVLVSAPVLRAAHGFAVTFASAETNVSKIASFQAPQYVEGC